MEYTRCFLGKSIVAIVVCCLTFSWCNANNNHGIYVAHGTKTSGLSNVYAVNDAQNKTGLFLVKGTIVSGLDKIHNNNLPDVDVKPIKSPPKVTTVPKKEAVVTHKKARNLPFLFSSSRGHKHSFVNIFSVHKALPVSSGKVTKDMPAQRTVQINLFFLAHPITKDFIKNRKYLSTNFYYGEVSGNSPPLPLS